jgi:hypothetical protein
VASNVEQRHDVRMIQLPGSAGFLFEALEAIRVL